MKRLLSFLCTLIVLLSSVFSAAAEEQYVDPVLAPYDATDPLSLADDQLYAQGCMLIDLDSGDVLYQKNADSQLAPASTTKIMTLLLGIEYGHADTIVTVPQEANQVEEDSSLVPVYFGEQMPFQDLLYGLALRSGNDAANAIATIISGSVSRFVQAMNDRAAELGMTETHFTNAHGYPSENHYTTARDLATLTTAAMKNPTFIDIIRTNRYTLQPTSLRDSLTIKHSYAILDPESEYYYEGAFGIKTGYCLASGQCYVGAAERDGHTLIVVLLHSGFKKEDKWIDAAHLFDYGFARLKG